MRLREIAGSQFLTDKKEIYKWIANVYNVGNNVNIKTFDGMPAAVEWLNIAGTGIASLEGISDHFEGLEKIAINVVPHQIKTGGLGLLLIDNFEKIVDQDIMENYTRGWLRIINKYAGRGEDGLIECQSELIEAGFEEYAVL